MIWCGFLCRQILGYVTLPLWVTFGNFYHGQRDSGCRVHTCKSTNQFIIVQYTKMIDRINELPIQWLRSSLLQRWHSTNICQPGKSWEEAFLYLSLGQADLQCCSVAILSLFSLGVYIFPCLFFLLNPWAANYTLLTNLILQFHLSCFAWLYSM